MRASFLLLLPCFAWGAASAQPQLPGSPAGGVGAREPLQQAETADPRRNQKIERMRIEDDGARIDELRVGGQSLSIVVQPKSPLPEYEFQPTDLSRSRPADNSARGNWCGPSTSAVTAATRLSRTVRT